MEGGSGYHTLQLLATRTTTLFPRKGNSQTLLMGERQRRGSATQTVQQVLRVASQCAFVLAFLLCVEDASADPVLASSLGFCKPVPVLKGAPLHCCLPAPTRPPIRWRLPNPLSTLFPRERKPAHVLAKDPAYVRKYNLAYTRMKALPDSDPRSYLNQWRVHCSFCNEAFRQQRVPGPQGTETGVLLQLHYSWTFLPWHRMYLYFHERILADLIDDPSFALPFWNWDNQLDAEAAKMPAMFLPNFIVNNVRVVNSALQDEFRNPNHMPPKILPLGYNGVLEAQGLQNKTDDEIKEENLNIIYNQVVTKVSSRDFLGGPYRAGTDNSVATVPAGVTPGESGGSENLHNTAHEWTGLINDPEHPDNEDMGNFIFAARDPIFFSHHSNVDRLWDVWKTLPDTITQSGNRKRVDYRDPDFLDTEFTFYDENKDLVIVTLRDSLDSSRLGYKYTKVKAADDLWINYKPKPDPIPLIPANYSVVIPGVNNTLGRGSSTFKVDRRPPTEHDLVGKDVPNINQLQEDIVLEGVKIPHGMYVRFDAFINFPGATRMTKLTMAQYVGTFSHLPSTVANMSTTPNPTDTEMYQTLNIRFSCGAALRRLGITEYNSDILFTIVVKGIRETSPFSALSFFDLKQDFQ